MKQQKYDIFISYRRKTGLDDARLLQLALKARGYNVFFDYASLRDGRFNERIYAAIEEAPVFILMLSEGSLDNCVNVDDWVRIEIEYALRKNRKIISIHKRPDVWAFPVNLPKEIDQVKEYQISELNKGSLFEESIDKIIHDRFPQNLLKFHADSFVSAENRSKKSFLKWLLGEEHSKELETSLNEEIVSINNQGFLLQEPSYNEEKYKKEILHNIIRNKLEVCEEFSTCTYGNAAGVNKFDIKEMLRTSEINELLCNNKIKEITNRFHLRSLVKYGGRSLVYYACDKETEEDVILKVGFLKRGQDYKKTKNTLWKIIFNALIKRSFRLGENEDNRYMVYDKIMNLQHRNIVVVKEYKIFSSELYYVAENSILGAPLSTFLRCLYKDKTVYENIKNRMSIGIRLLYGVASGLDFLHENGIIHCDIKPDNIMIDSEGSAILIDFGESFLVDDVKSFQVDKIDVLGVSPLYMAPEQWMRTILDYRTDQYSLAVIAYQIVFQRLPFEDRNFNELRNAVVHNEVSFPCECPIGIQECFLRALAKKKEDRYSTCVEFIKTLDRCIVESLNIV